MLMLLVLVLLPLLVVELGKHERSHKSSSHPSLRLVADKAGAGAHWRFVVKRESNKCHKRRKRRQERWVYSWTRCESWWPASWAFNWLSA